MIYLLIDNASLLNLIHDDSEEDYVGLLETLVENQTIALFSHQTLNAEWQNHKYDWQNRFPKTESGPIVSGEQTSIPSRMQRNVDKLDTLLLNVRETFLTNQGLEQESISRFKANQAPFRKGSLKGLNDWNILGSLCYYCEQHIKDELYFISHNHTDFADPTNPSEIDPTIADRFPSVKINYYKNYSDFFKSIELRTNKSSLVNDIRIKVGKFSFEKSDLSSKKKPRIIQSLHNIFEKTFEELTHIPPRFLVKLYPFSKSISDEAVYRNFSVDTPNETLIRFFESLQMVNQKIIIYDEWFIKNCEKYQEKIEIIISRINDCLIYSVGNIKDEKHAKVLRFQNSTLLNTDENYYSFSFNKISTKEFPEKEIDRNKLKRAYFYFQLGDLYSAYILINDVRKRSKKNKKYLTYLIAIFNLGQLYESIRWSYSTDNRFSRHILEQLSKIDVDEEINKFKYETHTEIAEMLEGYKCFYHTLEKISKTAASINAQYQSQLIGGRANNNFSQELISHFLHLDTFFSENGVLFDHYSDYKELFESVFRGLIASIAIKKGRGSRLEALDDYLLIKIITYCDRGTIVSQMNHYRLNRLPYESEGGQFSFNQLVENFFCSIEDEEFMARISANHKFMEKIRKYLENFLLLGSYVDLKEDDTSWFVERSIKMYITNSQFSRFSYNLSQLISKRGRFAKNDILIDLVKYCLENLNGESVSLVSESLDILLDKGYTIVEDSLISNLLSLENNQFIKPLIYNELLVQLSGLTSSHIQEEIVNTIISRSYQPKSAHITCLALADDIIAFSEEEFVNLIDTLDLENRYPIDNVLFATKEPIFKYREVDHFINTCFAKKIQTNSDKFQDISQLNEYYKWLLDMDNFTYEQFDAEWILHLNTRHCFDRMALSKPLLRYLYEKKSDFQDYRIESAISEIFGRLI
ncbi:hypothetical protein LZD49_17240 [Dyadobacter sp. CY261]|uniref:hypothetical protein n=1 Tax=Dyadobacter sp. CY261 TaxID=2907203 RepID=UPI001F22D0A8|nr:hypothetical protein [Dyadobacter sp. CY261]MCF0072228.1 hypothetical protein [Dyadobacter sp. CY261]